MSPADLSNAITQFVHDDRSYDYLPEGTWWAGGCALLALGIAHLMQDKLITAAPLVGLKYRGVLQHVAYDHPQGLVFDADGMEIEEGWKDRFTQREDLSPLDVVRFRLTNRMFETGDIHGLEFDKRLIGPVSSAIRAYLP